MDPNNRTQLEAILNYTFTDSNLLWEALQSNGNGVNRIGTRNILEGNKQMALLGDTVLKLVIIRDWFAANDMTREVAQDLSVSIGSNENLIQCGRDNHLEIFINRHNSFINGPIPPRTMSATVEALIGAVFVDSNESLTAVKRAMRGLVLI